MRMIVNAVSTITRIDLHMLFDYVELRVNVMK